MFGGRYFGARYFGLRYFGKQGLVVEGRYFGGRYFGGRYFGPRYWGSRAPSTSPFSLTQTNQVALSASMGVSGNVSYDWVVSQMSAIAMSAQMSVGAVVSFDNETDFAVTPPLEVSTMTATMEVAGDVEYGFPAPGDGAYFGWRYWGGRYFGSRYWGTQRQYFISHTNVVAMSASMGVSGGVEVGLDFVFPAEIAMAASMEVFGDLVYSEGPPPEPEPEPEIPLGAFIPAIPNPVFKPKKKVAKENVREELAEVLQDIVPEEFTVDVLRPEFTSKAAVPKAVYADLQAACAAAEQSREWLRAMRAAIIKAKKLRAALQLLMEGD